eukprot:scaffold214811_cov63-Attheya_sp.AAC.1
MLAYARQGSLRYATVARAECRQAALCRIARDVKRPSYILYYIDYNIRAPLVVVGGGGWVHSFVFLREPSGGRTAFTIRIYFLFVGSARRQGFDS